MRCITVSSFAASINEFRIAIFAVVILMADEITGLIFIQILRGMLSVYLYLIEDF